MIRPRLFALTLAFLVFAPAAFAESKLAPFYSLPADGAWIEYEWKRALPDKKEEQGTMRLSSVGTKDVDGVRCRWVEIKVESKRDGKVKWQRRKLLVDEKAFARGKALEDCLRECYHHDDANPNVIRLSEKRIAEFLRMGLPGEDRTLHEEKAMEEVEIGMKKYQARHMSVGGKVGDRKEEYHGWLTKEVPFGVAKFEIHEQIGGDPVRVTFTATMKRSGKDAKSELDETMAK